MTSLDATPSPDQAARRRTLAWARAQLAEQGLRPTESPTQVRTWNLSSMWRVPVEGQTAWLKVVPHFFAHEGPLLALMAGASTPTVWGRDGGRILLAEIAGEDLHEATLPQFQDMVTLLVSTQQQWVDRVEDLIALGLPDWRAPLLIGAIADVVDRTRHEIAAEDRSTLADFVRTLPSRFDEVAKCGLRDTLVHGDSPEPPFCVTKAMVRMAYLLPYEVKIIEHAVYRTIALHAKESRKGSSECHAARTRQKVAPRHARRVAALAAARGSGAAAKRRRF